LATVEAGTEREATTMSDTEERRARANERLGGAVSHLRPDARIPFLCECEDAACDGRVYLTLAEYEEARTSGRPVRLPQHRAR
jgi:hypothetical protein